jgi:pre-rRNA-processing protein TSR4
MPEQRGYKVRADRSALLMLSSSQVMPQLLNHLKADRLGRSIDWGVLAVFTCAESCSLGSGYTEEFVWKQDVTDTP